MNKVTQSIYQKKVDDLEKKQLYLYKFKIDDYVFSHLDDFDWSSFLSTGDEYYLTAYLGLYSTNPNLSFDDFVREYNKNGFVVSHEGRFEYVDEPLYTNDDLLTYFKVLDLTVDENNVTCKFQYSLITLEDSVWARSTVDIAIGRQGLRLLYTKEVV